jgi:hypothetical protein
LNDPTHAEKAANSRRQSGGFDRFGFSPCRRLLSFVKFFGFSGA